MEAAATARLGNDLNERQTTSLVRKEGLFARWNHEYWPWYLIYLPVLPGLLIHALRSRSLVFFSNVNPAIDMGGFFGERKSEIYALLPEGSYPTTLLIAQGSAQADVASRMRDVALHFPLIAKPDIGERGEGVQRVGDERALQAVLAEQCEPLLLQALVPWTHEYGLMFLRDPASGRTTLLSITGKAFLTVQGDGSSSVEVLLRATYRGRKQVERLRGYKRELLESVPMSGECVLVEPVGNHCRGTIFLDRWDLMAPELERALDVLMARTTGIHYGRLDVRTENEQALREGKFTILELNGVSSEPGHIYDPSLSIFACWRELLRHVKHLPELSRAMSAEGARPVTLQMLITRCESHFGARLGMLRKLTGLFNARRTDPPPSVQLR